MTPPRVGGIVGGGFAKFSPKHGENFGGFFAKIWASLGRFGVNFHAKSRTFWGGLRPSFLPFGGRGRRFRPPQKGSPPPPLLRWGFAPAVSRAKRGAKPPPKSSALCGHSPHKPPHFAQVWRKKSPTLPLTLGGNFANYPPPLSSNYGGDIFGFYPCPPLAGKRRGKKNPFELHRRGT